MSRRNPANEAEREYWKHRAVEQSMKYQRKPRTREQQDRYNAQMRERQARLKSDDPAKHHCACGKTAVRWDQTTHDWVCKRCSDWEACHYGYDIKRAWCGFRKRLGLEPYTIHCAI